MLEKLLLLSMCILACTAESVPASEDSGPDGGTAVDLDGGGHSKYRIDYLTFPSDSILREIAGSSTLAQSLETRLKIAARHGRWDVHADYQLIVIHAEEPQATRRPRLGKSSEAQAMEEVRFRRSRRSADGMPARVSDTRGVVRPLHAVERSRLPPQAGAGKRDSLTLSLAPDLPEAVLPLSSIISDDRRWWNLTYSYGDDRTAIVHRLDRLSVGFTTERSAWRLGRQAISWGNGMIFTPMDVFNPFDPAAVDKEYKSGDDMVYGQYLLQNGDDLQGVAVVRRNPDNGEVEMDQSSLGLKYHGLVGPGELDLLAARHYGDRLFGLGGNVSVGGAVWRGDLTWTQTADDDVLAAVTSLSYSWNWYDRNVSGVIEYYYNGFGQADGRYAPDQLAQNPALLARLERGELYTLARNYLGASATVEVSPLLLLTANAFINFDDPSSLIQLVVQYSIAQDLAVTGALNVPVGPPGSEYGGIPTSIPDRFWSTGPGLFAQLAWYF